MASGLGGAGGIGGGSESGVIGDIMAQLQALFYRKMHLNVTQMGHSPASPPVALPRLNKTMALQMPAVTSALRRLQESLVGLAAAGSLTIPELIEKLDTCAKVFPPKSRPLAAARVFAFETLAAALARIIERGERSRAFAIRSLQGLEPAHINLLLDGLVAPIVAVDFVDNFGGGVLSKPMAIAGQSMDADANSHSTGSINAATAAVIGAMAAEAEKCLASLSNFMLVLVVNGVCDRFMGVQPSLQQDQGQSHLNIQSIGWEGQVKYLLATSRWKFGLIDPPMRSSTCRFLRAVLEFVVPSATRTAQKKVVVTCLVGIWRTLMAETRATPQANIQWQELLENEEDQLQVYLDIHGEAFTLMQKWARKTKLRVHALSLMQVLLCHGTFEFFRSSKQREHFTITVMAACGDQACRPDVLDVLAAYIREVPSIFISQIREAWRLEAMNLMSSAFPRSKAAPVAELRPLTDCLVALGASELEHTVGAITNLLASSRHHSSHKIVALRALARLLRDNPPLEIGRQKEELITMVTACLKEKDQPFLIGEALRCVPMLLVMATDGPGKWMFYEREKEGEKRQREDGKEALVPGTILKHGLTQAEVLNLMRELCWWSDRTIALEATVALRENIHMLPMHLLSAALRIACRTITNSLNAVAEDWRRRLTDVEAVLYEFLRRFSPRGSKMAQHFSRMCSSRGSSLSGTILPGSSGGHHHQSSVSEGASRQGEQSTGLDGGSIAKGSGGGGDGGLSFAKGIDLPTPAQWARIRVKVEGIVVLALAHHDRTVWMQAYQLLRLLDHDLFRAIEEPSLRDNGVLSHRPSPRASPRRTPSRYDRFGSGRYSGYGFGLQSVIPSSGFRGGSRDGMHSRRPSADVERPPFLADCLLRKPLSAVDLDVWRTRGAWCNVHWAPELWYLLLQQYDRYEVCLQWAWSKIVNHNIWSLCPKARSQATNPQSPRPPPGPVGQSGAVVSPPAVVRVTSLVGASGLLVQPPVVDASKSTSGITDTGGKIKGLTPEMMDGAFQLWRNLLHFAILCLRLPNHPEFDLEEAARNLDKYDAKGEDRNRGLSVGFNTAKKYMVEFTDSQAKAWIRKRRMPRVSVQHCLRRYHLMNDEDMKLQLEHGMAPLNYLLMGT
ncbi:hypothetical protein CBR_g21808 [Chara braunii]|uniref:Uncharacterized protein n=1 Tax=Chara braunii TaxID=69332 RepID=A0A388JUI2_CHABU|nr:hypothetical protein CBR_g21808 [Chara braunii]|eukprot:GBG61464.1 hypothetical protein CBR_g21808 [Chara braunii]